MNKLPAQLSAPREALRQLEVNQLQRQASAHAVEYAKKLGADQAIAHYSKSQGFELTVRQQNIEQLEHYLEQGLSISLYRQQRKGSASTNDLTQTSIERAVQQAYDIAQWSSSDPYAGLAEPQDMAHEFHNLDNYHPWNIDPTHAQQLAQQCEQDALQHDPTQLQGEGCSVSQHHIYSNMANSHGFQSEAAHSAHSMSCSLLAKQDKLMQRDYDYTSHCNPEHLVSPEILAASTVEKTLERLGARKINTQTCSVLFNTQTAHSLWRSVLGALSGGAQYRKQSFLQDRLGKNIAPDWLTLSQQPHLPQAPGSRNYDYDGVQTQERLIIDQGSLASYILSAYSARQLGLQTTGNAGGIQNILVSGTAASQQELMDEMQTGFLVTELMGQGVNMTTGDYSRGAFGYWIENGKIAYPVHEVTLAGNLIQLLSQLRASSNHLDSRRSLQCGALWVGDMVLAGS